MSSTSVSVCSKKSLVMSLFLPDNEGSCSFDISSCLSLKSFVSSKFLSSFSFWRGSSLRDFSSSGRGPSSGALVILWALRFYGQIRGYKDIYLIVLSEVTILTKTFWVVKLMRVFTCPCFLGTASPVITVDAHVLQRIY